MSDGIGHLFKDRLERMAVRKAPSMYGIPWTTLIDHKLGKVRPGTLPGRPSLLSTTEEDLVNLLVELAAIGYG